MGALQRIRASRGGMTASDVIRTSSRRTNLKLSGSAQIEARRDKPVGTTRLEEERNKKSKKVKVSKGPNYTIDRPGYKPKSVDRPKDQIYTPWDEPGEEDTPVIQIESSKEIMDKTGGSLTGANKYLSGPKVEPKPYGEVYEDITGEPLNKPWFDFDLFGDNDFKNVGNILIIGLVAVLGLKVLDMVTR